MERRNLSVELRSNNEDGMSVSGIVNTPGQKSKLLYSNGKRFREVVAKGVFQTAIDKASEILFLNQHDRKQILASTKNDSLTLTEGEDGVEMSADIVDTSYGKDAFALMNSGIVGNMSFGFNCLKDSWSRDEDGVLLRTLEDISLHEVSCVQLPAYDDSSIACRGYDEEVENVNIPELENEQRSVEPEVVDENKFEFKNEKDEVIGFVELREASVDAKGSNTGAELFFYNSIGNSMWEAWFGATVPQQIVSMIEGLRKFDNVNIRINSGGGSVFGGYAIANLIKTIPGKTVAHVDGLCASIATVIALACDEVVMPSNSVFMVHKPSCGAHGDAKTLRKQAAVLDTIQSGIVDLYMERANKDVTREQMNALVDEETWMSASEASKIFNIKLSKPNTEMRFAPEIHEEVRFVDFESIINVLPKTEPVNEGPVVEPEVVEPPVISDEVSNKLKAMLEQIKNERGM